MATHAPTWPQPVQGPESAEGLWPPPATLGGADAPRGRRRWRLVKWAAIGVVAVAVGGSFLAGVNDTVLTHDLLDADFESGAQPFSTGEHFGTRSDVVDGTYRMQRVERDVGSVSSAAPFARTAYNVHLSADVVQVDLGDEPGGVGLACVDGGRHAGYALFAGNGQDLVIRRFDDNGEIDLASDEMRLPATPYRLTLSCSISRPGSDRVIVTGSLNGREVLRADDPNGIYGYSGMRLMLASDIAPVTVRFDNVTAVVPE